ncbi:septation protein SepH [Saccharopolyspora oryzae]|uniref:Septation protein SepH n=1 Tax=Saccharopolyspora oryzae TaxID=2997343 RepID=A0ABT4UW20_9PSEU|nr:septation protein SepH [Saccharopolyspora oryzae]MDA3625911.1 septation protein SepH [Saccharopolyspora oryzae]
MRALRVVGLDEDGESVICEDPENGERFTVPADERLRAAARGDLTRLGQVQIEMEAQMRPREIQARIRSGASVEQIAEASGIPEHRIERYAYPVLLERRQIAEMAQRAHPVREDGPDVQTLGEVVAHTFGMRGHEYAEADWGSWRGEDGKWVIQLTWQAGRSENLAHWVFHPGAHGGTVAPLDDHAADLLDPSPNRPLRTVRPVTELAREALQLDQQSQERPEEPTAPPVPEAPAPLLTEASVLTEAPKPAAAPLAEAPTLDLDTGAPERPAEPGAPEAEPAAESAEGATAEGTEAPDAAEPRRGRKSHPIVPSWEDVLLGVRSHR